MACSIPNPSQLERGDRRVFVNLRPGDWNVGVWLTSRQGEKTHKASVEKGHIKLTEIKEGEVREQPFLKISVDVWQMIVEASVESTHRSRRKPATPS
jgi:hypothetical protein